MSIVDRILYWIGYTPWERLADLPAADQIAQLFAREEAGREPPYGAALDLGCGSGIWSVALANRGWDVTGIDLIPRALDRARQRANEAGIDLRLVQGDVTELEKAGVGSDYRLLLDFGCFHDRLTDAQRAAEGRGVSAVAAPDASLLLLAIAPDSGRIGSRGASRHDIAAAFPGWTIVDEETMDTTGAPGILQRSDPRFYRLQPRRG